VHHNKIVRPMSALGQKRTSEHVRATSALPPKADIAKHNGHVRFVPKADISLIFGRCLLYLRKRPLLYAPKFETLCR
jgi:hypothetical protein